MDPQENIVNICKARNFTEVISLLSQMFLLHNMIQLRSNCVFCCSDFSPG